MIRRRRRLVALLTAAVLPFGVAIGLVAAGAPAASASTPTGICDLYAYCLNDWNGGAYVKVYDNTGGNNDEFVVDPVNRCHNGDYTTTNCPFKGAQAGHLIFQIEFYGVGEYEGYCVATSGGVAVMGTCNETSYPGTGGATGTIYVSHPTSGCLSGESIYQNNYWTTEDGGGWAYPAGIFWEGESYGTTIYNNAQGTLKCLETTYLATPG
jgi:hypothetical protein